MVDYAVTSSSWKDVMPPLHKSLWRYAPYTTERDHPSFAAALRLENFLDGKKIGWKAGRADKWPTKSK